MSSAHNATGVVPELADRVVKSLEQLAAAAPIVLIDGPAGAGKSTLADSVLASWPDDARPQLLRMDDVYPGWSGLAAGSEYLNRSVLAPLRSGLGTAQPAGWRRYDWATRNRAEWHPIDRARPLIVEGCGALTVANVALADLAVWIEADDVIRKHRALTRDHGGFDPFWDMWQEQFEVFVRCESPQRLADLVLDGTPEGRCGATVEP